MYNLTFEAKNGTRLLLNYENGINISRVEGATGLPVSLQTAQGYQQIGQSVSSQTVKGRDIIINGFVFSENARQKKALMAAFAPFSEGRLYWENKYFLDVVVKNAPNISQNRDSTFSVRLFAPFPFWSDKTKKSQTNGQVTKEFSFPVNYATPHRFGTKIPGDEYVVYNSGEVESPFELNISGSEKIIAPKIINVKTGEFLKFNGEIDVGETFKFYQDGGKIRVVLVRTTGEEENVVSLLDEESSLFTLYAGDNRLKAEAEDGSANMVSVVSFYPLYSGVLMDGV